MRNGKKSPHPIFDVAQGLNSVVASFMSTGEQSCTLSCAPGVFQSMSSASYESTVLLHGTVFWGGFSVFHFATVLFQLIKLSVLRNANGNYEAKGALLQEVSAFFVLNEAVPAGAFGKTFFSRVLYNLVALALS